MAADAKSVFEEFVNSQPDEDAVHVVCCDDEVALCGSNVKDHEWVDDDDETTCIACNYLSQFPCWRCGE